MYVIYTLITSILILGRKNNYSEDVAVSRRASQNVLQLLKKEGLNSIRYQAETCDPGSTELKIYTWGGLREGCACQRQKLEFHDYEYCMTQTEEGECKDIQAKKPEVF